jgi:WD40 repeat protein
MAFAPGGNFLVMADGGIVRLWDARAGREIRQFQGPRSAVSEVAIAPDGEFVAATYEDATVIFWDVRTGRELRRGREPVRVARDFMDQPRPPSIAFAPDSKSYALSNERDARLCDVATGREIRRFPRPDEPVQSFTLAPDAKTLAAVCGHSVLLWNVATGRETLKLAQAGFVWSLAFDPSGHLLATGDADGVLRLWDAKNGQELRRFFDPAPKNSDEAGILCLVFLPDGKTLAAGDADGFFVKLWSTTTGQVIKRVEGHADHVRSLAMAPGGKTMASASADGTALVWDVAAMLKSP